VRLQISFTVGLRRNWLNLWKPRIDALDPLLGRTRSHGEWHPRDGRIIDLGLHLTTDTALVSDVILASPQVRRGEARRDEASPHVGPRPSRMVL
jgi:hypothetical protein